MDAMIPLAQANLGSLISSHLDAHVPGEAWRPKSHGALKPRPMASLGTKSSIHQGIERTVEHGEPAARPFPRSHDSSLDGFQWDEADWLLEIKGTSRMGQVEAKVPSFDGDLAGVMTS
jgi:hypothetical protein